VLAAVIDRFSRRVVGWSECRDDRAARDGCPSDNDLAPRQARCAAESLRSRKPAHQGAVPGLMADNGIICSMSRSGNVWDNAAMESDLLVAQDRAHRQQDVSDTYEARIDVFDYIERFYNSKRRHSTIGYLSPMEFDGSWIRLLRVIQTGCRPFEFSSFIDHAWSSSKPSFLRPQSAS
jgi:putative transposase